MLGGGERCGIHACHRAQPGELAPIQVEAQPPVRPLQGRTGRRRSRSARGCRRSHLVSVFAPASRAQSTRDSCPSPTPGAIPSRTYATELDRVKRRTTSPRRRSATAGSPSGECATSSRVSGTSSRGWPSRRPPTSRTSTSGGDISGSASRTRAALLGREHLHCPGRVSRHDPVAGQSPQQVDELRVDGFGDRPPSRRTTRADRRPGRGRRHSSADRASTPKVSAVTASTTPAASHTSTQPLTASSTLTKDGSPASTRIGHRPGTTGSTWAGCWCTTSGRAAPRWCSTFAGRRPRRTWAARRRSVFHVKHRPGPTRSPSGRMRSARMVSAHGSVPSLVDSLG
ncbi:MAG: hypothetical protein QOG20_777 [Pseudonocardiales bacterium]|jgi:hypothetical protein|nr:hypothetical protein [Pseudonocardiales bacterium]